MHCFFKHQLHPDEMYFACQFRVTFFKIAIFNENTILTYHKKPLEK